MKKTMLKEKLKVLRSHGTQYIKNLKTVELPAVYRGRPVITPGLTDHQKQELERMCPVGAIGAFPLSIDLGRCCFCKECHFRHPDHIVFTNDYRMAANVRERLVVREGDDHPIEVDRELAGRIPALFSRALKLREVSAGGDNSCEMELNASGNVNFDLGRYGIEFTASPRHADGVVVTGPVTRNMAAALQVCYDAMPAPKIVVLAGCDAISGGLFAGSPALDREFVTGNNVDLYLPGNPVHPLTFIHGILDLTGR